MNSKPQSRVPNDLAVRLQGVVSSLEALKRADEVLKSYRKFAEVTKRVAESKVHGLEDLSQAEFDEYRQVALSLWEEAQQEEGQRREDVS